MPAIDFSEVQGLDPVPEGTYRAEVTYAQEGVSQSGNDKIDIRYRILEVLETEEELDEDVEGRLIFDTMSFHPKALWRTKRDLISGFGFDKDFSGEVDPEEFLGEVVTIQVSIDPGEGVNPDTGEAYPDRNRINRVLPAETTLSDLE